MREPHQLFSIIVSAPCVSHSPCVFRVPRLSELCACALPTSCQSPGLCQQAHLRAISASPLPLRSTTRLATTFASSLLHINRGSSPTPSLTAAAALRAPDPGSRWMVFLGFLQHMCKAKANTPPNEC